MNEPLGNIYLINNNYWLVLGFHQGKLLLIQLDPEANGQTYVFDNLDQQWAIIANVQLQPAMLTVNEKPVATISESTLLAIKEIRDIVILCFQAYMNSIQN